MPSFISSEGQQVQQFRIPHQCGRMLISLILKMPPTEESILFLYWWARRRCLLPIQYHVKSKRPSCSLFFAPTPAILLSSHHKRKKARPLSCGGGEPGKGSLRRAEMFSSKSAQCHLECHCEDGQGRNLNEVGSQQHLH